MSLKALKSYTFTAKYANYLPEKKRRETWDEAVDRVRDMHLTKFPMAKEEIDWAFERLREKKVLASQRSLQFGGAPILKKNARLYNCTVSYCDRPRFFQECLWMLLCGCGVGFSVQKPHVEKLPEIYKRDGEEAFFDIPDTIEGWADALGILIASYMDHPEFPQYRGKKVRFGYGLIRPKGAKLSSCTGKAPGPEPLEKALKKIEALIERALAAGQTKLRPIDCYDIVMHSADAVLAGGLRRSATLSLFSPDDEEMIKAKTGNWYNENPQRGRSNNSALLIRNKTSRETFANLMKSVREFGEPGFVWADDEDVLFNPCVAKDSVITTKDGLKTVSELVGKQFVALIDGKDYFSSGRGFWKTGDREVYEFRFKSGRKLKVTGNHQIMTVDGWKEADDLTFEDEIVINKHRCEQPVNVGSVDYAQGYCLGNFLSDGNVIAETSAQMKWWGEGRSDYRLDGYDLIEQAGWLSKHHNKETKAKAVNSIVNSVKLFSFAQEKGCLVGCGSEATESKHLSKKAISGNWSYLAGLIAGYFDGDGTVAFNPIKGSSIRIGSSQLGNLENLQIILNAFGIYSTIYNERYPEGERLLPDGRGGEALYLCQESHELCISRDSIEEFHKKIPIKNTNKLEKIKKIVESRQKTPYRSVFTDTLISKKLIGVEDVYDCTVPEISAFDANGVYVHNCVEIGMWPKHWKTGVSGFSACNLSEINGSKVKTKEDFFDAAKAASIIGTLQAGYTDFAYLGQTTKEIIEKEALLGVSITGMMDNPDVVFDKKNQREAAEIVKAVNKALAEKIGINQSARTTCIKPSGTASCLLGTASGIHPHHAKRYIRRVQANKSEAPVNFFKTINPMAVEHSVWSANNTDDVISFCVEVPDGAKLKNDTDAISLLKFVKSTQQNWVEYGTNVDLCVMPFLRHNVSNTITVKEEEWEVVEKFIYDNREFFAGISLLPFSGDKDYPQAPFTSIHTTREIVQLYGDGSMFASGLIVDGLHAFEDNLWKALDCVKGYVEPTNFNQSDWVRRTKQFAVRYFDGDEQKTNYCLKDVYLWHKWCELKREYKDVDYSLMVEETDETNLQAEGGCYGGQCEIIRS